MQELQGNVRLGKEKSFDREQQPADGEPTSSWNKEPSKSATQETVVNGTSSFKMNRATVMATSIEQHLRLASGSVCVYNGRGSPAYEFTIRATVVVTSRHGSVNQVRL